MLPLVLTVQRPLGLSESGCQSLTAGEGNLEGWECESPAGTPRAAPTHLSWGHRASYSPPDQLARAPWGCPCGSADAQCWELPGVEPSYNRQRA